MKIPKLDKTALSTAAIGESEEERTYWHRQTPYDRLQAIELLRKLNYGDDATSGRLERVLEIARRE